MLPDGHFVFTEHGAAHDGVPDAGSVGPVPGHERRPGGGAGGGNVVICQDGGFAVERVEVGSLDDGVAVAGEIAVALVVGDDDDDVRLLSSGG